MLFLIKLGLLFLSGGLAYYVAKEWLGANAPFSAVGALAVAIAGYARFGSLVIDAVEALIKGHRGE